MKYFGKIVLGSALCASSMAFAAEPASSSVVLSEQQMDSVTAGTVSSGSSFSYTRTSITQTQGDTKNVSFSPTIGANLAFFNWGGQNVGSYTYQSGGTQVAVIK